LYPNESWSAACKAVVCLPAAFKATALNDARVLVHCRLIRARAACRYRNT
jgi:hypothetical protein